MSTPGAPLPKLLSVRAVILRPIFEVFADDLSGLKILLHRHGLDSRLLEDHYAPVPLQSYLALFEDAATHLGDPGLGLRLGSRLRPGGLGPMGLRAAQCATIRRGLESLARFSSALQSGTQVSLEEDGPHLILRYMLTAPQIGTSRQDSEFSLAGMCSLIRKGFDLRWRPDEVHFTHPAPEVPNEAEHWFDAPVLYSQPVNMLVIDAQDADRIHRSEDPDMLDLIDHHLAGLFEEAHRDHSTGDQVRALIALYLGARPIDLTTISGLLQTSPRSLQRHLAEEGETLSGLLQAYRQERAELLLRDGRSSVEAIAISLGYADGTAFWRAYRGWTGQSPSQAKDAPR